jgi:uncharacterized protein YraI
VPKAVHSHPVICYGASAVITNGVTVCYTYCHSACNTVELGYNVMKGTEYVFCVIINECRYNRGV